MKGWREYFICWGNPPPLDKYIAIFWQIIANSFWIKSAPSIWNLFPQEINFWRAQNSLTLKSTLFALPQGFLFSNHVSASLISNFSNCEGFEFFPIFVFNKCLLWWGLTVDTEDTYNQIALLQMFPAFPQWLICKFNILIFPTYPHQWPTATLSFISDLQFWGQRSGEIKLPALKFVP